MNENSHLIDWSIASSVIRCKSFINRNLFESPLKQVTDGKIMNVSRGLFGLDNIIVHMFRSDLCARGLMT